MEGYYKNAPKEDEVLLRGVLKEALLDYGRELIKQPLMNCPKLTDDAVEVVLTKAREAVEGAEPTEDEVIELIKYTPNKVTLCYKVIKRYRETALKALGGE